MRGAVRKSKKQAVLHADKAKRSSVQKAKVREALMAVTRSSASPNKHDRAAVDMQQRTRENWKQLANDLAHATTGAGQVLARQIHQFLARMPAPETERMQLQKQLRQHLQQQKDHDNANSERTV